jgi:hypothetical protein
MTLDRITTGFSPLIQIKARQLVERSGSARMGDDQHEKDAPMRRILLITALAAASALTLTVSTSPASAARYCLQGAGWGYPGSCQFRTFAQCRATASGTNAGCGINPRYAYARQGRTQQQPAVNNGWNNNGWNNNGWNNSGWNNSGWNGNPNNRGGLVGGSDAGTYRP